jgi:hypothetical protein
MLVCGDGWELMLVLVDIVVGNEVEVVKLC